MTAKKAKNNGALTDRESFPISAATLSHHLKELETSRLISIAREGKFAYPTFRREVWNAYLSRLTEL